MNISGHGRIHDKAASLLGVRPVGSDSVSQGSGTAVAASKDSVDLSSRARVLSEGNAVLAALPDIRLQPVMELKHRIESDAYQVEGEQVSDAIIRETLLDDAL